MAESRDDAVHLSLTTLAVVVLSVTVLYLAKQIVLPIALAALLSFLLTPLVSRLERTGMGRVVAVVVAVSISLAVLTVLGAILLSQLVALGNQLPTHRRNLIAKVRSVREAGGQLDEVKKTIKEVGDELTAEEESEDSPEPESLSEPADPPGWVSWLARPWKDAQESGEKDEDAVEVKVVQMPPSPLTQVHDWLGPLVAPMTTGGIVIVLVLFILIQREDIRDRVIQLFGTTHLHTTTEALNDAAARVSRYLRMHLLINACYGVGVGTGLYVLGLPNAMLWGVLGLLLRFLPYLGPWIAASMPIFLSFAVFDTWSATLMVVGLFIVLELVVNNVLEPLLYGNSVGVSSVGIVVAAVFWTWLWGPIGLVLAVPLTVCLVVTGQHVPRLRFFVVLFGNTSTLSAHERLYQRLLARDYEEAEKHVLQYVEEHGLEELFETLFLPTLELAETDRHAGVLKEEAGDFLLESLRALIEAAAEAQAADEEETPDARAVQPPPVLCIPADDEADELAALMLAELLAREGVAGEVASPASLSGEYSERAGQPGRRVAVISILPPVRRRKGRYLVKRLRRDHADLPIVVGAWRTATEYLTFDHHAQGHSVSVATSLREAVDRIRSLAQRNGLLEDHSQDPDP